MDLPGIAIGTPMTYMLGGKQYIALTVGGDPVPELSRLRYRRPASGPGPRDTVHRLQASAPEASGLVPPVCPDPVRRPEPCGALRTVRTSVMNSSDRLASRRQLLKWLAGKPAACVPGLAGLAAQGPRPRRTRRPDPMIWAPGDLQDLIASPEDAINVFDFEPVARKNVPPAHFGYMASGHRRRGDAAREPGRLPEVPAQAAAARRRQQGRHEHRHPRRAIRHADRHRADRRP